MHVLRLFPPFSNKNQPARPVGHSAAAPGPALPPARRATTRNGRARLLTAAGLLALLAGAGCEPSTPAKSAQQASPAANVSPSARPLPPPAAATPSAPAARPTGLAGRPDSLAGAAAGPATGPAPAPAPAKPKVPARPKGPVRRDTIGNALAARLLGGPFDVNILRYRRDPATPLMLKLVPRTTLMVGVNSSESRLYRLFAGAPVPPAMLARPLGLDRLAFEPGQAVLGPEAAQQLGNLAALLRTFPKVSLRLYGHSATTEPLFWKLGNARGRVCLAELVKQGIAPARLRTEWLAPQPKDPHPQGLSVRVVTR